MARLLEKSLLATKCRTWKHFNHAVSFCHYFQLREEKLQEEKASEDLIHKFVLDDMEGGKRKTEEQQKKDESLVLKVNQECVSKIVFPLPRRRHWQVKRC